MCSHGGIYPHGICFLPLDSDEFTLYLHNQVTLASGSFQECKVSQPLSHVCLREATSLFNSRHFKGPSIQSRCPWFLCDVDYLQQQHGEGRRSLG